MEDKKVEASKGKLVWVKTLGETGVAALHVELVGDMLACEKGVSHTCTC